MSKYYDKTAASFKSVTIDTKVLDAQKILINSDPEDINQRENLLDVLNSGAGSTPTYTEYQYIDYCEKPSTTGTCCAVKLHYSLLPHDKDIKAIRFDIAANSDAVNTETWLVAYLVDANNNFTSIGKSVNSNTWVGGDLVEWEFEETFRIPEGSYLQLYIADANSTISATNVTRPSYKIALYVINDYTGENPDSVRFNGTWYSPRRVYVQFKEEIKLDLASKLGETINELTNHIGDDTHLTTEQKNAISGYLSHVGDSTHLTTEDRTLLSDLANNGSKSYDWTPNIDLKIQFSLANDYTTPVNGWLVINSNTTDDNLPWSFTVNGKQSFNSDQRGNLPVLILLSKNDVISTDSTTNRNCYFLPCKSEVLDYRITNTPYDIWANAIVEDENGNLSVQNLHVPDASSWIDETPEEVRHSIVRVEDEVAYDMDNNLVCNIQSSEIVNGSNVFNNCLSLTSFSGDLSSLINGDYMFDSCTNLSSFSGGGLSSLTTGIYMFSYTPLASFNEDLSNLTEGGNMFNECANLTSFSGGGLSSLIEGNCMFKNCANLTSFNEDLSSLVEGGNMFDGCTKLTSFSGNLSSLALGAFMFYGCNLDADSVRNIALTINNAAEPNLYRLDLGVNTSILSNTQTKNDFGIIQYKWWALFVNGSAPGSYDYTPWSSQKYNGCINVTNVETAEPNYPTVDIVNGKWTEHLCELLNGTRLFFGFTHLTSFSGDLSSLVNGKNMFHFCTGLTSFNSDLSSLVDGSDMFSSCVSLTSFKSNLSSLVNGYYMFHGCNALTSFRGNLSSLTNGYAMFTGGCELDTESIKCIADTIKDVTGLTNSSSYTGDVYKQIFIDTVNSTPTEEEQGYFNTIVSKGWTVIANGDTYAPIN